MIWEVLYLLIALVALMLRRIEHWISGQFSGTAVTQIKRGELESRDAKYLKKLEKRKESERHEIERGISKHRSDGVFPSIKIRKTPTMIEILNRTKKTKVKSFQSEAKRKQILKTAQVAAVPSIDVTKQELPNPVKIEQDTSSTTKNCDKFVKYKNKKVQLSPPLKENSDTTVQAKATAAKLPPLKERLRNKDTAKTYDNNFKPKHKRKLSDILRNLPKRITSHKSIDECNVPKENQSQNKELTAKKKGNGRKKNERTSSGDTTSKVLPGTSESQEANKMKDDSSNNNKIFAKKRKKNNFSDENRLKQDSSTVIKPLKSILKRSSTTIENRDHSLQTETVQAKSSSLERPSSVYQGSSTSSTCLRQGEHKRIRSRSETPSVSEDNKGSGPAHALQPSKVDKCSEDFTNPEVILKYRLATTAGNKKQQADNILNETTYENYKRDLTASPKFKPLTRPLSADSSDTENLCSSPTANGSDFTGEKRRASQLYDNEELMLMDSIEKDFL